MLMHNIFINIMNMKQLFSALMLLVHGAMYCGQSFLIFTPFTFYNPSIHLKQKLMNLSAKSKGRHSTSDIVVSKSEPELPGAIPPLGYWDPLQLTSTMEPKMMKYVREAELHHGRISMAAMTIMPILDFLNKEKLAINMYNDNQESFLAQLALSLMTIYEASRIAIQYENPYVKPFTLKESAQPGNMFNLTSSTLSLDQQNKELSNGRLAMVGAFSYVLQELVTQQKL